jgi:hypothetical protein
MRPPMPKMSGYRFKIAADEVPEEPPSINPLHVALAGTAGFSTALPDLARAAKVLSAEPSLDMGILRSELGDPLKKGLGRAALTAALVASYPYLKDRFGKMVHGVKSPDGQEKQALNRSTIYRRQFGPKEFHIEYPKGFNVGGVESKYDYGYLPGVKSPDGDSADFYVGDDLKGGISRFTKTLPGQKGLADYKYFVGLTPEQMDDYQKRFPEYTHSPGAALVDRKDFKDWNELEGYLAQQPRTGFITRLQESIAAHRAPMKVANYSFQKSAEGPGRLRQLWDRLHASRLENISMPLADAVNMATLTAMHPIAAFQAGLSKEPISSHLGRAIGYTPYAYGAYRAGKYLYDRAGQAGQEVLNPTQKQKDLAEPASTISPA